MTEPEENPSQPQEVRQLPQASAQVSLEDLIKLAGPYATEYFKSKERMHQSSLAFETQALQSDAADRRNLLIVVTILSLAMVGLAVLLVLRNESPTATTLITLMVSVAGAGFGGYGLAKGSAAGARGEDDD